jgi:hypothetical protein
MDCRFANADLALSRKQPSRRLGKIEIGVSRFNTGAGEPRRLRKLRILQNQQRGLRRFELIMQAGV